MSQPRTIGVPRPAKRMAAGLLVTDQAGRVLLVKPTYKPYWEIPGGAVEEGESPHAAAAREVKEELSLQLAPGRLLLVDWVPPQPARADGVMFVFDGGVLGKADAEAIRLPPRELRSWALCTPAEAQQRLSPLLWRRVAAAIEARDAPAAAYLENGRHLGSQSTSQRRNAASQRPQFLVEREGYGYLEYQVPISVKLVIDYHGRVPLLRNERDEWELPGGKLEAGERPDETVSREVAEELGLTINAGAIIDTWVYEITPMRHVLIVSYGAVYRGEQPLRYSFEHKELGLFDYDQVSDLPMPKGYKTTIQRWKVCNERPDGA